MATKILIRAIAVTSELLGTEFSEAAAQVFAADLSDYPEPAVLAALERCRREVKGRLSLADVINRIDDGRPGAEEAWSMIPRSEAESVVWTTEMAKAMSAAQPLLESGDAVAARMAFIERYRSLVTESRSTKTPVSWSPSFGFDQAGREVAVRKAIDAGRITTSRAVDLIPNMTVGDDEAKTLSWLTDEASARLLLEVDE